MIRRLPGGPEECALAACDRRAEVVVEDCEDRCVPACSGHALDLTVCSALLDALGGEAS